MEIIFFFGKKLLVPQNEDRSLPAFTLFTRLVYPDTCSTAHTHLGRILGSNALGRGDALRPSLLIKINLPSLSE